MSRSARRPAFGFFARRASDPIACPQTNATESITGQPGFGSDPVLVYGYRALGAAVRGLPPGAGDSATIDGIDQEFELEELTGHSLRIKLGDEAIDVDVRRTGGASFSILVGDRAFDFAVARQNDELIVASPLCRIIRHYGPTIQTATLATPNGGELKFKITR